MNFKNTYPRKDQKKNSDLFHRKINSNFYKRKADFNLSDNDSDDIKVLSSNRNFSKIKKHSKTLFMPNISITKKFYTNLQDKFELLEKLDSLDEIKEKNLRLDRPMIAGTCQDMCPEKERYSREYKNFISVFEKTNGKTFDSRKAVKEYDRCVADQKESLPHHLRPTEVLQRTMNYLLTEIVDQYDDQYISRGQWYTFLWNRTRSIKKDITQQNLCNEVIVNIIEQITRFHIFCSAWLCEDPKDVFEPKLNEENLKNCLQTLKDMYSDLPADSCANEPEFRSYMMILNLDKGEMLDEAQKLTSGVFNSPKLSFVIDVYQAILTNNYVRFFRLLEKSDLILSCLLHRFIAPMRFRAFEVYNKAYVTNKSSNQIPLNTISRQVKFDDIEQALEFCRSVNQEWVGHPDNIMIVLNYSKLDFGEVVPKISRSLVQNKRGNQNLSTIFTGGQLLAEIGHELPECKMVSFDENGCYIGTRPIPQNLGSTSKPISEQAETEVISIESSEEELERSSPFGNTTENMSSDNFLVKEDKKETTNIFRQSYNGYEQGKINLFNKVTTSSVDSGLFSSNSQSSNQTVGLFQQPKTTQLFSDPKLSSSFSSHFDMFQKQTNQNQHLTANLPFKFTISQEINSNIRAPSPEIITKEPLFSQEELHNISKSMSEELISEFVPIACHKEAENTFLSEKQKQLESDKLFNTFLLNFIKKEITEKALTYNANRKVVMDSILEDLISESVENESQNIEIYAKKKQYNDKMRKFYQMKLFFNRWHRNCDHLIKSRKSLSNLRAAPRMKDDFAVCQDFRGKVRKVCTKWFVSKGGDWCKHPLTSRLDQLTGSCQTPSITVANTQSIECQTIVSYFNVSSMKLGQFIQDFVKFRFINVLDHLLENLQLSNKVHPTLELLISDYNEIINDMQKIIQSKSIKNINFSSCFLPVINFQTDDEKFNKQYIDEIFQKLHILPNQRKYYFSITAEYFSNLEGGNVDLGDFTYFHLRLFPWINIIKQSATNRLDILMKTLPNKEIEIEKTVFSPLKLQSECVFNEISVQFCVDKCIKKVEISSTFQVKTPKRLRYFNDLCNGINQLSQKLDEFKKSF